MLTALIEARKALFKLGGIAIDKHQAVPTLPEFQRRADAYNVLTREHARLMA